MGEWLMCPCCEKVRRFIRMWWRLLLALVAPGFALWWFSSHRMEILTFLAVVVALLKDLLYQWFVPARLVITCGPDGHVDHVVVAKDKYGNSEEQFWFDVAVKNDGPGVAKKVQLLFNGVESNMVVNFGRYECLSLHRSYREDELCIAHIPSEISFRFNVSCISAAEPNKVRFQLARTPNALGDVECRPDAFFEFEIVAVSDNAPVARARIRLTYDGNFPDGVKAQIVGSRK